MKLTTRQVRALASALATGKLSLDRAEVAALLYGWLEMRQEVDAWRSGTMGTRITLLEREVEHLRSLMDWAVRNPLGDWEEEFTQALSENRADKRTAS